MSRTVSEVRDTMDNASLSLPLATGASNMEVLLAMSQHCYTDLKLNHSWPLVVSGMKETLTWCPRIFDGFACWDETPAGATAVQMCPDFVIGFDPKRQAFKSCTDNGTWMMNSDGTHTWTNYTTCVDTEDLKFRTFVNIIYMAGYAASVISLLFAIFVFLYFRNLQCMRVRIHIQLFTSISLNGIMWILWYNTVVNDVNVVQQNPMWCQALHVVIQYFMVTNYMWMFTEGLHLHIALVVVFLREDMDLRWFAAVGWGAPFVIVGTYAAVRSQLPAATNQCWMNHSDAFWIIIVPVVLSLISSFVFLVNVLRVLVLKVNPELNNDMAAAAKKALKAALILVPLFGLHFLLIPLRPNPDSPLEGTYQVISALLTSLQGLCVAILFCFTNNEVRMAARAHMERYRRAEAAIVTFNARDQANEDV